MNSSNYDGRTGKRALVSLIVSVSQFDFYLALHLACAEGHLSCVKFLVETCELDPMARDRQGTTIL